MTPVFNFTAYSGTGKTTYVEKLIACLCGRGVRVGAVKHDAHDFDLDRPGKDSWRFARAGAAVVALASDTKCAVMEYRPVEYAEIIARIKNVDVIICEGYHAEGARRVVLWRSDSGRPMKLRPGECVAVVSDAELDTGDTPLFPLDNVEPMADFIMGEIGKGALG